jgi:hypothetical protein
VTPTPERYEPVVLETAAEVGCPPVYLTHREAAEAVAAGQAPAARSCPDCRGWHLSDVGPVRPCNWCGRVVFWTPKLVMGGGSRLKPTDPVTRKVHNLDACRRVA